MSPLLPPAAGAPAGDLSWRSDPAPPLDLHGPRDVAFRRLEPGWAERPALDLFAEVVARWPEAIACRDLNREVGFAALWSAARHLAASIDAAIPKGQPVGVLLPNQATYPAAVLACLAAARPCVLIDRNHPQNRVAAIVRDAGLSAVVMYQGDIDNGHLLPAGLRALAIDGAFAAREAPPPFPALPPAPPNAPDFIVYTSGSTGRPKGIVLDQRAVLHRAAELVNAVHLHNGGRVLSLASPGTIGGLQQIFEVMLCGATLVKLDLQRLGLSEVLQAIVGQGITMMFSTPAVWRAVAGLEGAREALAELRCVRSSGDVLLAIDHELLRRVLPMGCAVLSVYGATEAPRSCNGSCKDGSGVIWSCVEIRGQVDSGHGARAAFLNAECADGKTIIRVEVRKYDFGVGPVTVRWRGGALWEAYARNFQRRKSSGDLQDVGLQCGW